MIKVKFFAQLRDVTGHKIIDMEFKGDVLSLVIQVCERFGEELRNYCLKDGHLDEDIHVMINGRNIVFLSGEETQIKENDEVAIIPKVGGG